MPSRIVLKDEARWTQPQRGPDGRYQPVAQVYPMGQPFVGGFAPPPMNPSAMNMGGAPPSPFRPPPSPGPPPLPPKDSRPSFSNGRPPSMQSSAVSYAESGNTSPTSSYMFATQQIAHLSPVERSQNLRVAQMNPYLQFMAGPLLRYDTVTSDGVWRGAALIVSECFSFRVVVLAFKSPFQPQTQGPFTSLFLS